VSLRRVPARLVTRGARLIAAAAVSALTIGGCGLGVQPFAGTSIALDISGAGATPAGHHLEMWGRNQNNDLFRISYTVQSTELWGLTIRPALSATDPCIINDTGYLLTDARAYPTSVIWGGIPQTPQEQAMQATTRIQQLTSTSEGGLEPSTLLVVTPYDATPLPPVATDAGPDTRKAACDGYWGASTWSYTGNPLLVGKPLHSTLLGAIDYTTAFPMEAFTDIALTSSYDLSNLREIWFTDESVPPAMVDPAHRGPVWIEGTLTAAADAGRGVLHFELAGNGVSGSMALIFTQQQSF
jgi:hypothetical protein